MSTLNLGNSPILKPMESGSGTLTATGFDVTYSYYKKDNVVTIQAWFQPTAIIAVGTSTTTSALPAAIRPAIFMCNFYSATNAGSGTIYGAQIGIYPSGVFNLFSFSGMSSEWSPLTSSFTYLVND